MAAKVLIKDVIEEFDLEIVSGEEGINRPITVSDISRPGLEMAGYFNYYPAERVQLLGKTELSFAERLSDEDRANRLSKLCSDTTPGIIITRNMEVPPQLMEASEELAVPVLRSKHKTSLFRVD